MSDYFGVIEFKMENPLNALDIFLYDTLDTVQQNIPPQACVDGVPPMAVMNHHLFTSLRGIFLAEPGDNLHTKNGRVIKLFKHVVLIDRYFFLDLTHSELDALLIREEVLYRHITNTGDNHALRNPREYYVTHDTLTCHNGVQARVLAKALRKSKRFECDFTAKIFKMDTFDRIMLKLMYKAQSFNLHSRIRNRNLRQLHKKPPLSLVRGKPPLKRIA